jgi:O-antigen/teichoic acid export membrane protein
VQQQGISIGVAAISGVGVLGVWNFAWRVLQVPILLFIEANRVAFPSMSRLLGAGHEVRSVIERGAATLAALTGAVTVALLALAPLLPTLVGEKWGAVPEVLLWSGFALVLGIPTTVSTSAYLFASGAAGAVALATLVSTLVWFGASLPLLPSLGAEAVGLGWVASCAVYAVMLWRATTARIDVALARRLAVPTAFALIASGAGWLVADSAPSSPLAAVAAIVLGEAVLVAGLAMFARAALRDTRSLVALALGRLQTPGAVQAEVPANRY